MVGSLESRHREIAGGGAEHRRHDPLPGEPVPIGNLDGDDGPGKRSLEDRRNARGRSRGQEAFGVDRSGPAEVLTKERCNNRTAVDGRSLQPQGGAAAEAYYRCSQAARGVASLQRGVIAVELLDVRLRRRTRAPAEVANQQGGDHGTRDEEGGNHPRVRLLHLVKQILDDVLDSDDNDGGENTDNR